MYNIDLIEGVESSKYKEGTKIPISKENINHREEKVKSLVNELLDVNVESRVDEIERSISNIQSALSKHGTRFIDFKQSEYKETVTRINNELDKIHSAMIVNAQTHDELRDSIAILLDRVNRQDETIKNLQYQLSLKQDKPMNGNNSNIIAHDVRKENSKIILWNYLNDNLMLNHTHTEESLYTWFVTNTNAKDFMSTNAIKNIITEVLYDWNNRE